MAGLFDIGSGMEPADLTPPWRDDPLSGSCVQLYPQHRHVRKMSQFHGSLDELKALVGQCGVDGEWEAKPHNCWRFKAKNRAGLNWSANKGTLWFDGPQHAKQDLEAAIVAASGSSTRAQSQQPQDKTIFVVHGHDHIAKEQLELTLHRLGLTPYVLQDSGGGGKTIVEALEKMIGKVPTSTFGIVLLTPDDMGYAKKAGEKEAKPRARQNVILEMGMLLASLTRGRVAILQKGFVESPSDLDGVLYIPFNEHVKETVPKLAQRLEEAGIALDANSIARASS